MLSPKITDDFSLLQLKGKNGVEFLIQYDTESIISDWHKVLTDTIRQLVSPVINRSRYDCPHLV